jgi:hypothetical protein
MPTPEARREERKKFDRHLAYVYFYVGVWLVALGIVLDRSPSATAVGALSSETQHLLGLCMFIGSVSGLIGICMGGRWFRHDTLAHPLDLRYPYAFAVGGLAGTGMSMWAYFVIILNNSTAIGTLGGGLSLAFGMMSIHLGARFLQQIIKRTRIRNQLTRQAIYLRDDEHAQQRHIRAVDDRNRARWDHGRAGDDHATAADDHAQSLDDRDGDT